jgi:hypothetical protein
VTHAARAVREDAPAELRQGWVSLYAVAFVLLLVAGTILVVDSLGSLKSISLLWVSAGFSVAAIIFAVACVVAPRR